MAVFDERLDTQPNSISIIKSSAPELKATWYEPIMQRFTMNSNGEIRTAVNFITELNGLDDLSIERRFQAYDICPAIFGLKGVTKEEYERKFNSDSVKEKREALLSAVDRGDQLITPLLDYLHSIKFTAFQKGHISRILKMSLQDYASLGVAHDLAKDVSAIDHFPNSVDDFEIISEYVSGVRTAFNYEFQSKKFLLSTLRGKDFEKIRSLREKEPNCVNNVKDSLYVIKRDIFDPIFNEITSGTSRQLQKPEAMAHGMF